jgi:phosphatidate cytidylyltransferase
LLLFFAQKINAITDYYFAIKKNANLATKYYFMPFDKKTFLIRAGSAVVFGAVMLGALLGPRIAFLIVFAFVAFLAAREYYFLQCTIQQQAIDSTKQLSYSIALCLFFLAIAQAGENYFLNQIDASFNLFAGASIIATILWMAMLNKGAFSLQLLKGYAYIGIGLGFLALLYRIDNFLPMLLIVCIWVNDTMQYLVGSFFGKTKMAPIISPKKTWEGTIGGSALCVLVAIIWGLLQSTYPLYYFIVAAICASVVGTLGDLLESKLKRTAGVKDSGNIMPGHGGALDRFDSLLLAAPACLLLLLLIKKVLA